MILNYRTTKYTDKSIELFYEYKLLSQRLDLESIIHESILIESGASIDDYKILTEGIIEKTKNKLNTLLQGVSKIIGNFIETVKSLTNKDKSYLNDYKDIILKKPLKETEYKMFKFLNIQDKVLSAKVPAFNLSNISNIKEKDEMISKLFPSYSSRITDKNTFEDVIEVEFRGSKEQQYVKSSDLNMNKMFNFCVDYENCISRIKSDLKSINDAGKEAIDKIKNVERTGVSTEASHYMEEFYYSIINEQIIYEEPLVQKKSKVDNELDQTVGRNKTNVNNIEGKNKEVTDNDAKNVENDKVEETIKSIELYIEVCTNFLSVKMSVMEDIYKTYMYIIRDHVRSYSGENKKEKSDNKKSSTTTTTVNGVVVMN